MHNTEIADTFEHLSNLLEIEGANAFRVRAYREAARVIRGHARNMDDLIAEGEDLSRLPNIGADLAGKIERLIETGTLPLLEEVEERTPATLSELMKIQGLGAKRVKVLYDHLRVEGPEDLMRAARRGEIRKLPGFGAKSEHTIKERARRFTAGEKRTRLIDAERIAAPLLERLKQIPGVTDICLAGSFRRRKATVGDLDILISAKHSATVMSDFVQYEDVEEVVSKGKTRSTVRLRSGMLVDLRVVSQVSYGSALLYFTGSKAHNVAVRRLGIARGYKVNEYGVFDGDERIAGETEKDVYESVGLPYIEPELRRNSGEIRAARNNALPQLVTVDGIRGDLHCHTHATNGHQSVEQLARAAARRGYEYLAVTDHSNRAMAYGLDERRLLKQIEKVEQLNDRFDDIVILKSIELDILEDGELSLPDSVLERVDLTVCSVSYGLNLSRKLQTERILRAMDNPHFNILAHPTGRFIGEGEPYEIDLEAVMEGARDRDCFLELNANPSRLDMTDDAARMAKDVGVGVAISTDAHDIDDLDLLRFGVEQARRGWLEAGDVVNTRPLDQLRALMRRT